MAFLKKYMKEKFLKEVLAAAPGSGSPSRAGADRSDLEDYRLSTDGKHIVKEKRIYDHCDTATLRHCDAAASRCRKDIFTEIKSHTATNHHKK
eukprot:g31137.t1